MDKISIHALLAESDDFKRLGLLGWLNFYPRSPCGERLLGRGEVVQRTLFLSTLSLRRATEISESQYKRTSDFYPRSPCGERRRPKRLKSRRCVFLSTLSLRRATPAEHHANSQQEFLSTLSLRRATARRASRQQPAGISIHALLAESDQHDSAGDMYRYKFLSTLSLRRATWGVRKAVGSLMDFYPRSPCGERHIVARARNRAIGISIHALLAESDDIPKEQMQNAQQFLSTLSLRRATVAPVLAIGRS